MTLRPRILNLKHNGEVVGSEYESATRYDGWFDGEYSLSLAEYDPPTQRELVEYAENRRLRAEMGGININGIHIGTDDRSKIMISGARIAASNDPNFEINWALEDGSTVALDATTIVLVSDAVLNHVSWVFELYSQIVIQIDNGLITTTDQIDLIL